MTLLIGKKAPEFRAKAVIGKAIKEDFSLLDYRGKYVVLFFYPLNFTFVCPTELCAFQEQLEAFSSRNAQVVGCSVDSHYSHLAWLTTPRNKGGIEGIEYPLISDLNKTISKEFDLLNEEGVAYRGLFILDKEGIVRHQLINDLGIGRSVAEALRVLDALQHHEAHGEVCPANWEKGKKGFRATQTDLRSYVSSL